MPKISGTHIILNGNGVNIDFSKIEMQAIEDFIYTLISNTGMSILWKVFHDFREPAWAFTGIYLLGESHFSIHTFPEDRYITVDLYTCNMTRDYSEDSIQIIHQIIEYFQIQEPIIHTLKR
jgi:S-adenosylmethionine decarboxylase